MHLTESDKTKKKLSPTCSPGFTSYPHTSWREEISN